MRPIKFRAYKKNKSSGKMYENVGLLNGVIHNSTGEVITNAHLMQFTGLLDKNGKEIWEGDIVAWKSEYTEKVDTAIVFYDEKAACFNWKMSGLNFNESGVKHFEVIGNIYENPELYPLTINTYETRV